MFATNAAGIRSRVGRNRPRHLRTRVNVGGLAAIERRPGKTPGDAGVTWHDHAEEHLAGDRPDPAAPRPGAPGPTVSRVGEGGPRRKPVQSSKLCDVEAVIVRAGDVDNGMPVSLRRAIRATRERWTIAKSPSWGRAQLDARMADVNSGSLSIRGCRFVDYATVPDGRSLSHSTSISTFISVLSRWLQSSSK